MLYILYTYILKYNHILCKCTNLLHLPYAYYYYTLSPVNHEALHKL